MAEELFRSKHFRDSLNFLCARKDYKKFEIVKEGEEYVVRKKNEKTN